MIWLSTYIHDFRILKRVPRKNSMFQTRIYSWCCSWSALDLCDIVCDHLKSHCVTYDTMWYHMLCWEHVKSFEPIWNDVKSCYVACNSFDYGRFIGNWSTSHGNHLKHVHSDRESWCWWIQCIPCEHVQSNEILKTISLSRSIHKCPHFSLGWSSILVVRPIYDLFLNRTLIQCAVILHFTVCNILIKVTYQWK